MTHREDCCYLAIEAIHDDVATISEVNQPFPKFGVKIINRAADLWLVCKSLHACPDCPDRAVRRVCILVGRKPVEPLYARQRRRGPDYS